MAQRAPTKEILRIRKSIVRLQLLLDQMRASCDDDPEEILRFSEKIKAESDELHRLAIQVEGV